MHVPPPVRTAVPPLGHGHADHPSNQASVRPTVRRPGLPTYKTSIVLTATIFTLFKATTKETTKEVARPKAAPPLLWWRPQAATFVMALNRVNIVAVNAILVLHVGKTGRRTVGRTPLGLHVPSPLGHHVAPLEPINVESNQS